MSPLCSGDHGLVSHRGLIWRGRGSPCHHHRFGSHHFQPVAPDLATWPISPKHRATSGWLRRSENRCRGNHLLVRDRPENRTDAPRFGGEKAFLTLGTQITGTTIANASRIQKTIGAITLWPAFLGIKGAAGGTTQRPIRLKRKCGSWKATGKRGACPLRGTILDHMRRFFGASRFFGEGRLDCRGEFGQTHDS